MKFFVLIFLFGLATASLHDILDDYDDEDFLLRSEHKQKGKDELETELGRKLRKTLDHILKEIKDSVHEGKGVSQELLDQAKDLVNKLKRYGVDVSDEAKDILSFLKTRIERWVEGLLDILRDNSSATYRSDEDLKTELGKKLRKTLRDILERIKKAVSEGKHVSRQLLDKARDLLKRLKEYGLNVSDEMKEMVEYLKERYRRWLKELIDAIRGDNSTVQRTNEEVETELSKKIEEDLKRILRDTKKTVEEGKRVSQEVKDEITKLIIRLKEYGLQVGDEVTDMLEYLKTRIARWAEELLDAIRGKRSLEDLINRIKEKFDIRERMQRLKDLIANGFDVEKITEYIKKAFSERGILFRQMKEKLLETLKEGKDRMRALIEKFFPTSGSF